MNQGWGMLALIWPWGRQGEVERLKNEVDSLRVALLRASAQIKQLEDTIIRVEAGISNWQVQDEYTGPHGPKFLESERDVLLDAMTQSEGNPWWLSNKVAKALGLYDTSKTPELTVDHDGSD